MNITAFTKTVTFKKILIVIAGLLSVLIVFQAGVFVGFRKAAFSYHMGDNYYRAFDNGPRGPLGGPFFNEELTDAHGASGKVLSITPTSIVIDDHGNEKTITLTIDSVIRKGRTSAGTSTLAIGDYVVVIGAPTETGSVEAKLIRILPPPPSATTTPTNY